MDSDYPFTEIINTQDFNVTRSSDTMLDVGLQQPVRIEAGGWNIAQVTVTSAKEQYNKETWNYTKKRVNGVTFEFNEH